MARPSKYSEKLAAEICEAICTSEKGIHRLCEEREDFPGPSTIYRWLEQYPEFREQYARARANQADYLVEQTLSIADETEHDTLTIKKGDSEIEIPNKEWILRSKLRVEARQWAAGKLAPKKYGAKVEADVNIGAGDGLKELLQEVRAGR